MPSLGSPNDNIDSIIINNNHKNNNGHGNNNNGHRNNNNVIKIHHRHSAHLPLIHTNYNCSRRYAEVGLWRRSVEDVHKGIPLTSPFIRGDAFLEPYMQGLGAEPPLHRPPPIAPKPLLSSSPTTLEQTESTDEVDAGSSCGEESSQGSSDGSDQIPCDIGLMERLIRSHPVWFLPGIQRAGAFHLLQGKEEGNFVVRQSSQSSTMAISVRLPSGKGPYIEHYLIQAASEGHLSLESSENKFPSIPALIAHYSQCCDELPVQLTLPRAIRDAKNRQQLSSLALLGQEFWRYPMANPRPAQSCADQGGQPEQTGLNSSLPSSQASSLTSFGSGNNNQTGTGRSPTGEPDAIVLNLSPLSDQTQPPGLLSTFKGTHPPESAGSPTTTWFAEGCDSPTEQVCNVSALPRAPRPTPPNTLNLGTTSANSTTANNKSVSSPPSSLGMVPLKTPPPPPPRWSKPFTVTTTVTFSMTETTSSTSSPLSHHVELLSNQKRGSLCDSESLPSLQSGTATLESVRGGGGGSSKSPVSEQLTPSQAVSPVSSDQPRSAVMSPTESRSAVMSPTESRSAVMSPTESRSAVMSPTEPRSAALSPASSESRSVLSPVSDSKPPHRRSKRHKESRHYQESDILESPTVYYRSSVADKVSDYEDIWGPESLTTFKPTRSSPFTPTEEVRRVPDILDRVPPCPAPRPSLTVASSPTEQPPSTPVEQQAPATNKQSSPFYCEPADAIKSAAMEVARRRNRGLHKTNRHSDPSALLQWPALAPGGMLERIDSKEELSLTGLSSSVDNLIGPRKLGRRIGLMERGKGNKPKLAKRPQGHNFSDTSWAVDSSWEFIGNEEEQGSEQEDTPEEGYLADRRFPSLEQQENDQSPAARGVTVQELIAERCPELRLPTDLSVRADKSDSSGHSGSRVSAYDNVTSNQNGGASSQSHISDDDTQTIFSEPWDSSRWETLLERGDDWSRGEERVAIVRTKSFKERLDPLLCAPRLAALQRTRRESGGTGATIRSYTLHLASDKSTVFSRTIDHFISCTRESKESRPQVVMRNMRQFMTGMKNYLVTHGEGEFERHVEKERNKLRANEFLNLDAILEGVMHKLVVRPLREHLYRLFVDEYTQSGAIQLLADNIKYARTKTPRDIGIRPNVIPPSEEAMEEICSYLQKLQEVDSPLEKLENLLTSIASIFNYVKVTNHPRTGLLLGADDFLPLFVWVLVQSGMVAAEIEADYMWGLLHPSLLSGEGGYYLTTLSSAVHVLKSFRACSEECSAAGAPLNWGPGPLSEFRSVLKIVVPDELNGSIITKTLPIRPNMTTKDVCKIIAHKVRITNPQDYGLYKLVDGEETVLTDGECPQDVKGTVSGSGKHCMFAYKRIDAKIAWPKNPS